MVVIPPRLLGEIARTEGKPITDNPFDKDQPSHRSAWNDGWYAMLDQEFGFNEPDDEDDTPESFDWAFSGDDELVLDEV
jgi:hypothetical protein